MPAGVGQGGQVEILGMVRGVTLAGIDSVMCPKPERIEAWHRLARDLDPAVLSSMTTSIALGDVVSVAEQLIAGAVRGRVIVPISSD